MQKMIISSEYFSRPNPVVAADTDCPGTRCLAAEHGRRHPPPQAEKATQIFLRENKWEKITKKHGIRQNGLKL